MVSQIGKIKVCVGVGSVVGQIGKIKVCGGVDSVVDQIEKKRYVEEWAVWWVRLRK